MPRAPREGGEGNEALKPGDLLEGRYQIESPLGEGGVGLVYRALQIKLHRRVAIKLLQQDVIGDEELKPRFEREALTLAALSHPHIVSLTDYGAVRGRPYLVMELLEGQTLRELIDQEGALEPGRALGLVRQILLALAYAHEFGIVHRDLKPANLLLQKVPCHEHLKVLDFGLVKFTPGSYLDNGAQLSRVGFTFGTPAYMSPEHAVGGEVDGRSDLYAVGVLLFELLTGVKPFDGELQDILRAHFQTPVPKLWEKRAELTGRSDLQALVERAMAKEREDRFADAPQMIAAIDTLLGAGRTRASEPTSRLAMSPAPLSARASRVSLAVAGGTRAALVQLRSHAGPVFLRLGRGVRHGAVRSYALTLRASKEGYAWLKPRAASWVQALAERARKGRSELDARQEPPTSAEARAAEQIATAASEVAVAPTAYGAEAHSAPLNSGEGGAKTPAAVAQEGEDATPESSALAAAVGERVVAAQLSEADADQTVVAPFLGESADAPGRTLFATDSCENVSGEAAGTPPEEAAQDLAGAEGAAGTEAEGPKRAEEPCEPSREP